MIEDESEYEESLTWEQIDTTAEGYPVYRCIELPGLLRTGVPLDQWRKLFRERNGG